MDKERIRDEADAFFEWPTHDKTHVTTTSMLIFAGVIAGMAALKALTGKSSLTSEARSEFAFLIARAFEASMSNGKGGSDAA